MIKLMEQLQNSKGFCPAEKSAEISILLDDEVKPLIRDVTSKTSQILA